MTIAHRFSVALTLLAIGASLAWGVAPAQAIGVAYRPWLIVRCRPDNINKDPGTTSYYNKLFTSAGAGTGNLVDYWRDMSFGQLDTGGSVVADGPHADANGWYVENTNTDQMVNLSRAQQIGECAVLAAQDYPLQNFYGVITLWPGVETTTTSAINATQTKIKIAVSPTTDPLSTASLSDFPVSPQFGMLLISPDGKTQEAVNVTAIHGHTLTVGRGINVINGPPPTGFVDNVPLSFPAGSTIETLNDTSYGALAPGQATTDFGAGSFTLALVNLPADVNVTGAAHEMGHGFGLEHSRLLSLSDQGYNNPYDTMSAFAGTRSSQEATGRHNVAYGGSNIGSVTASKGPGLDAIQLDDLGVMPSARVLQPIPLPQDTIPLHSLSDPSALTDSSVLSPAGLGNGLLELRFPVSFSFEFSAPVPATPTTPAQPRVNCLSDYYTLEYREATGPWDSGLPAEKNYWSPKDATLKEADAPKHSSFPDGSVILDLHCFQVSFTAQGNRTYGYDWLVDTEPDHGGPGPLHNPNLYLRAANSAAPGAFWPGDEFRDTHAQLYFAVNEDLHQEHTAIVSIGDHPMKNVITDIGPSIGHVDSSVIVTAALHVGLNSSAEFRAQAVVPGHVLTFRIEGHRCSATTDLSGRATCAFVIHGRLGKTKLKVTTDKTTAYAASSGSSTFDVLPPLPRAVIRPIVVPFRHVPVPHPVSTHPIGLGA